MAFQKNDSVDKWIDTVHNLNKNKITSSKSLNEIESLAGENVYKCYPLHNFIANSSANSISGGEMALVSKGLGNTSKVPEYVIKGNISKNEVQALEDFSLLQEKDVFGLKDTIMMPFLGFSINTVLDSPNTAFSMQIKMRVLRNFVGATFNLMDGEYGYPKRTHNASQKYGFDPHNLFYGQVVVDHRNFNVYLVDLDNAVPMPKCIKNSDYTRLPVKKYVNIDGRKKEPLPLPYSYFTDLAMVLLRLVLDQCKKWDNIEKNDTIQKVLSILPQIQSKIIDGAKSKRESVSGVDGAATAWLKSLPKSVAYVTSGDYKATYDESKHKYRPKRSCDTGHYAKELSDLFSPLMKILLKEDEGSLIKYKNMSDGIKVFRSCVMLDNEDEEWSKRFNLVLYLINAYELFHTSLQKNPRLKKLLTKGIIGIFAIEIEDTGDDDLQKKLEDLAKYEKISMNTARPDTTLDTWDYWDKLFIKIKTLNKNMSKFLLKKRWDECYPEHWLFKNKR